MHLQRLLLLKKIVEQKNYKEENRCNIPHISEINFFHVHNSLIYRRQEGNTNRFVMKAFEIVKIYLNVGTQACAMKQLILRAITLHPPLTDHLVYLGLSVLTCKMGILILYHFTEGMNLLTKILAAFLTAET